MLWACGRGRWGIRQTTLRGLSELGANFAISSLRNRCSMPAQALSATSVCTHYHSQACLH